MNISFYIKTIFWFAIYLLGFPFIGRNLEFTQEKPLAGFFLIVIFLIIQMRMFYFEYHNLHRNKEKL